MNRSYWLLFTTLLLSVWNAGIVWFTQIAVYPLWPLVDASHFHDYHLTWWHDMWPAFAPVILMFLCSVALLRQRPARGPKLFLWLGIGLQVTVHTLTILFWAPIQASMATPAGMSLLKYQELMDSHWLRVSFFVFYAALMIWLFARATSQRVPPDV